MQSFNYYWLYIINQGGRQTDLHLGRDSQPPEKEIAIEEAKETDIQQLATCARFRRDYKRLLTVFVWYVFIFYSL